MGIVAILCNFFFVLLSANLIVISACSGKKVKNGLTKL